MTRTENLLLVAIEECAELQKAISKAMRFGMNGASPAADAGQTHEQEILLEYTQLCSVMSMLAARGIIHPQQPFPPRDNGDAKGAFREKGRKVLKYLKESERLGTVQPTEAENDPSRLHCWAPWCYMPVPEEEKERRY